MQRILIIEDDVFLGDAIKAKLQIAGYEVTISVDGAEGFQQLKKTKPDLVLLDLVLPTMNGYEIMEAKHADPEIAAIPTIIISNSGQPVEVNRALSLGVKNYLVKAQLDPEEVIAKIRAIFGEVRVDARLKGKKILWVEDDQFLSEILTTKFANEACVSLYAENAERALEVLQHEKPDVIVTDLVLPGMAGLDFLKALKAQQNAAGVPIIVLSNLGQQADVEKTKEYGAVKHLVKASFDPDDLVKEIADVLQ